MLVVAPSGDTQWLGDSMSPPLCGDGRDRPEASTVLAPGSLLVLYSDGLIERRGVLLQQGLDRLAALAGRLGDASVETVCEQLIAAVDGETARTDDIAVLAVRLEAVPVDRFRFAFPGRPEALRTLRREMRAWMGARGLDEGAQHAALLAVGEACANAIEHAYEGREPGEVRVVIDPLDDRALDVSVRDFGRFKSPSADADRGRGSVMIRELATHYARESTDAGTTVRFRLETGEPGR
jgi:anti-sigma regulatory factor (Ser/Thr protein kinase)